MEWGVRIGSAREEGKEKEEKVKKKKKKKKEQQSGEPIINVKWSYE